MLHTIAENFSKNQQKIREFFEIQTKDLVPPLYLSCDLRNSGHKLAVIDTNLFPAGFNNLCNAYSRTTTAALKKYFAAHLPGVSKVILLIEEHTRNRFYLDNIHRLVQFLESIPIETRIAYPGIEISAEQMEVSLSDGKLLHLEKLRVDQGLPQVKNFTADIVLSNNDFSQGIPELLLPILEKIIPSPSLGWHVRRKSRHFSILQELIESFAKVVDLDPWLLSCQFEEVSDVDVNQKEGLTRLGQAVEQVLKKVQSNYDRYQFQENPYLFVKNNSGTYGMGVTEVMQAEEIFQMNRRTRNKLLSSKGGQKTNNFLVQEGIPTADFYSGFPIEPVIYMVGFEVVGGFFRMNPQRDALSSLNTRGMEFSCLCLHKLDEPHETDFLNCAEKENLVRLSSVMAKIAALAAAKEYQEIASAVSF